MDIRFDIHNEKFLQAVEKAPGIVLKNMRLAMKVACRDVQKNARAKHRFRSRTGALEMGVDTKVVEGGDNVIDGIIFIDDALAPYGKFVHTGTRPHVIRPKNKNVLRWPNSSGSGFGFARIVRHPGTKPDEFVYQAGERNRQHINDVFNRYTDRAVQEAGL